MTTPIPSSRRRSAGALLAVAAIALAGPLAGCGKAAEKLTEKAAEKATEKAIESQGGDGAKVDIGKDGKVKIETEDGSLDIGGGEVPDTWPNDIPLPDDMKVNAVLEAKGTDGGTSVNITFTSSMDVDGAMAFFAEGLAGWEGDNEYTSEGGGVTSAGAVYTLDRQTVALSANTSFDDDGGTIVSLSYDPTGAS